MPKKLTDEQRSDRARIGATLRTLRTTKGWKVVDFASELGVSYSYLLNIEAGRRRLPEPLLARASVALGVDQDTITDPADAAVAS